jgi:DNA-binding NarL/FixJ family response regulator
MTISVLLVDDHQLIREGLRHAFERSVDCQVVAEAASVGEGLAQQSHHHAKVVITDLRLPDGSGLDLVRQLRQLEPDVGLVVLTMFPSDEQLFLAIEAGASAFLAKDLPSDEVVRVARGAAFSPRSFTTLHLDSALARKDCAPQPHLSPKERHVLQLLANGDTVGQIGGKLFISISTTKTHITRIYEKLSVGNRAQAVIAGIRLGLLDNPAEQD